jgi:hypothetical protein
MIGNPARRPFSQPPIFIVLHLSFSVNHDFAIFSLFDTDNDDSHKNSGAKMRRDVDDRARDAKPFRQPLGRAVSAVGVGTGLGIRAL